MLSVTNKPLMLSVGMLSVVLLSVAFYLMLCWMPFRHLRSGVNAWPCSQTLPQAGKPAGDKHSSLLQH